jgi:hypothetical protein
LLLVFVSNFSQTYSTIRHIKIELNQPVEPVGVETINPLEDCSILLLYVILYFAEICVDAPMNKSLNAKGVDHHLVLLLQIA